MARAWRNHPFVYVPAVDTQLSRRRVLVTELIEGRRFEQVKQLPDDERDRFGEIVFRFFFGTLKHTRRAAGDPHPGNYLLLDDGRVGFLDFGLMRVVDADYLEQERQLAQAVAHGDAPRVHALLTALGYLPEPDTFEPGAAARPDPRRRRVVPPAGPPAPRRRLRDRRHRTQRLARARSTSTRCAGRRSRRRRCSSAAWKGLVFATLGEVRAEADWHALGKEYWGDAPPSTPLGKEDARFWG